MNTLLKHTGISLLLIPLFLAGCASTYYAPAYDGTYDQGYNQGYNQGPQVQVNASVSFYDELSPYGRWTTYPGYDRVWIPNAGPGFRPYSTNGHWVYTDYGWTWASDYAWGWAAFHYGRWLFDDYQGWMWVPGYDWGPAWVSWRSGGDCYGWAPMGPQYGYGYSAPASYWTFVPRQYINSPQINNYYINNSRNVTIINNTTVINNSSRYGSGRVYTGPSANEVSNYSGMAVRPVRVENTNRPNVGGGGRVENNQLRIYRPDAAAIQRGRDADRTRPVQSVDNSRPGRVNPGTGVQPDNGNNGNFNNRPGRVTPGNNGNQPINNGRFPGNTDNSNNNGRVRPGQVMDNNQGNNNGYSRPSRVDNSEQIRQQQMQQQQQRIQQQQIEQQRAQQQQIQQQQQQQQQQAERVQRQQQMEQQRAQQQQMQQQQRMQEQQQRAQEQQQRTQEQQQRQSQQQQGGGNRPSREG
jgi:hypothetical protein